MADKHPTSAISIGAGDRLSPRFLLMRRQFATNAAIFTFVLFLVLLLRVERIPADQASSICVDSDGSLATALKFCQAPVPVGDGPLGLVVPLQ
jgi:hypothetical protein